MNETIKTLLNHRSIRDYKPDDVSEEDIRQIMEAMQAAPSSANGQHVTVIMIKNKEKKAKIAQLCGNQQWIEDASVFFVFCADFYRTKLACDKTHTTLYVTDNLEATIIGSVDVGLAMQNTIIAAESLGYGIVPIGGVRNNLSELVELLNIPQYVIPVCGLVLGVVNDPSAKKPRLPLAAVFHREEYNKNLQIYLDEYDNTLREYMLKRTNGLSSRNFSETVSGYYGKPTTRDNKTEMLKQGFQNK